eukprot:tig00020830_g14506.t1
MPPVLVPAHRRAGTHAHLAVAALLVCALSMHFPSASGFATLYQSGSDVFCAVGETCKVEWSSTEAVNFYFCKSGSLTQDACFRLAANKAASSSRTVSYFTPTLADFQTVCGSTSYGCLVMWVVWPSASSVASDSRSLDVALMRNDVLSYRADTSESCQADDTCKVHWTGVYRADVYLCKASAFASSSCHRIVSGAEWVHEPTTFKLPSAAVSAVCGSAASSCAAYWVVMPAGSSTGALGDSEAVAVKAAPSASASSAVVAIVVVVVIGALVVVAVAAAIVVRRRRGRRAKIGAFASGPNEVAGGPKPITVISSALVAPVPMQPYPMQPQQQPYPYAPQQQAFMPQQPYPGGYPRQGYPPAPGYSYQYQQQAQPQPMEQPMTMHPQMQMQQPPGYPPQPQQQQPGYPPPPEGYPGAEVSRDLFRSGSMAGAGAAPAGPLFARSASLGPQFEYHVFISYRRAGGADRAHFIRDRLAAQGYKVFMDVTELGQGNFESQIVNWLRGSACVLVVLSPGALDRCRDEADWVRKELAMACALKKTIVPVTDAAFTWPHEGDLPDEIRAMPRHNGVMWHHDMVDACMQRICAFVDGSVRSATLAPAQGPALAPAQCPAPHAAPAGLQASQ